MAQTCSVSWVVHPPAVSYPGGGPEPQYLAMTGGTRSHSCLESSGFLSLTWEAGFLLRYGKPLRHTLSRSFLSRVVLKGSAVSGALPVWEWGLVVRKVGEPGLHEVSVTAEHPGYTLGPFSYQFSEKRAIFCNMQSISCLVVLRQT